MSIKLKNIFIKVGLASLFGLTAFSFAVGHSIAKQEEPIAVEAASHPANFDSYSYSGSYYNNISSSATGSTLRAALTSLIHPTSVPTYSSSGATHLSTVLQYADEDPTNSANMIYLYTRDSVKKNAASSWNREHVWPQSLSNGCWGKSRAGTDLLHLRPTYDTTNGTRSNFPYGEISKTSAKVYNGITYGYQSGGYFMPLDSVKGDVARICMYVWTAYYEEYGSKLPALTTVFQSFDVLMQWHINDQPDVMEGNRNDYAETSMQKNRNPFVDHPEFAWKVFGSNCSTSVLNAAKAAYPEGGTTGGSVTMSQSSANMAPTEAIQLSAKSSDGSGISWSTSDSTVASLSNNSSASETPITITAGVEGTATIYAQATIGGATRKASCQITVSEDSGGGTIITGNEYTIGWGSATGTEGTYSNFNSTSGEVSGLLNFSCSKNSASSAPATGSNNDLRLYFASSGDGGSITIAPASGITIRSAVVTALSGYTPTVKYVVDNGSATSVSHSNNKYTISNISASTSLTIQNGNTTNTQLRITTIKITFDSPSGPSTTTLKSISVSGQTQNYVVGETFSFDGTCTAKYSDGSTKTVTPTYISSPDMSSSSNKTITVKYSEDSIEVTTSYVIYVVARTLSSIELEDQTTTYHAYSEFSFDGYVLAHYSNAEDDYVEPTSVSSPDMTTTGTKTITVSYSENGKTETATYSITVNDIVIDEVVVITKPTKTTYYVGDTLDLTGLEVSASIQGSTDLIDVTDYVTVSSPNMSTTGTKTVTVTFRGVSDTFTITVSERPAETITATVSKNYFVGEKIVSSDITVKNSSGTTITGFAFANNNYQFTYSDASSGGALTNKTFTSAISYSGMTCDLTVNVQRKSYSAVESVTDTITASDLTATTTSYVDFSGVTKTSGAVYAGQSAKNGSNIQLKSKGSTSGIVSTTSGRTISSVKITVGSGSNTINVYGKNTAYSAATDLYSSSSSTQGTFVGSVSSTGTVTFTTGYSYVGIRSNSGAVYISSIEITYGGSETATTLSNYVMFEDTNNQCTTKFTTASKIFSSLSSSEKSTFMTSNDYVISTARTRLQAWAAHEGKSITYTNNEYVLAAIKYNQLLSINDNNVVILIVVTSLTALLSLGAYIVLRKRRGMNK